MRWKFALMDRSLVGLMIGFSYFPKEDENDYTEFNIFLLLIVLHFKFY